MRRNGSAAPHSSWSPTVNAPRYSPPIASLRRRPIGTSSVPDAVGRDSAYAAKVATVSSVRRVRALAIGPKDLKLCERVFLPSLLVSSVQGVKNVVVEGCGHVVEGRRGGQLVELSTAVSGARSASSTCPQPGCGPVGLAGTCSPKSPGTSKSVPKQVAHVPVACPQPERL